jgi:hypothetical protein
MFTISWLAKNILALEGDELYSQYLRASYVYPLSIAMLFPPLLGGMARKKPSTIVSSAKATAAAKLFDHRAFSLDSAWASAEYEISGVKLPRKTLRTRALFADRVASSLFSQHLFHPKGGIVYLLKVPTFDLTQEEVDARKEELEPIAELVNIYMLCGQEIKEKAKYTGIDIAINMYLNYVTESGNRAADIPEESTLVKKWHRFKSAAVFQYLYLFQDQRHPIFSPPAISSNNFVQDILSMSEYSSIHRLLQLYDYVSTKLNEMFELDIPVIGLPVASFEPRDNCKYRKRLLALLKSKS